jgi:DNA-binding response OmpR family regulator
MSQSVLIVDDDDNLRVLLTLILKRAGHTVYQAASAIEALDLIQTTVPDLFIIDVMMPNGNGYNLCMDLREHHDTASRPIIMLSSRSDEWSVDAARDCGADRYLTKPVPTSELVSHVEEALRQRIS